MTPIALAGLNIIVCGLCISILLMGFYKLSCALRLQHNFRYGLLKYGHLLIYAVPVVYLFPKGFFHQRNLPEIKVVQLISEVGQKIFNQVHIPIHQGSTFSTLDLLFFIYLFIVFLNVFKLIRKYLATKNLLANSEIANFADAQIHLTDKINVPITFGLFQPSIYLPKTIYENLKAGKLRAIIKHELIHIQRGDFLFKLSTLLQESIWFFNPIAQHISKYAELEMEITCDELVIAEKTLSKKDYGLMLIEISTTSASGELVAMGATTSVSGRINAMKENKRPKLMIQLLIAICLVTSAITTSAFALNNGIRQDMLLNYGVRIITAMNKEDQKSSLALNYGEESVSKIGDIAMHIRLEKGTVNDQLIFKFIEVSTGQVLKQTSVPFIDNAGIQVEFPNQEVQKIIVKLTKV